MKTKKFLAILLTLVMILSLSVSALAVDTGTIEPITEVGVVSGSDISVSGSSLQWYPADSNIGRWTDGWWVGVKISAPTGYTSGAKYSGDKGGTWKDFDTYKDGDHYITCWLPIQPSYLENALPSKVLQWTYQFKWSGESDASIQTFTITVQPGDITLLDENGETFFKTENGVIVADNRVGENNVPGSITMNNAVIGETYKLYKVFDLTFTGENTSYSYTKKDGTDNFCNALAGTDSPFTLTDTVISGTYNVSLKEGMTAADVAKFLKANETSLTEYAKDGMTKTGLDESNKADAAAVKWENIDYGYYYIESSLGSLITVNSTLPNVIVEEKNEVPTLTKEVYENSDNSWGATNDANTGDVVKFKITVTAQPGAENYVIHDSLDEKGAFQLIYADPNGNQGILSGTNDFSGTVFGKNIVFQYTTSTSASVYYATTGADGKTGYTKIGTMALTTTDGGSYTGFTITFIKTFLDSITENTNIVITYSARLIASEGQAQAAVGFKNTAYLTYGTAGKTANAVTTTKTWTLPIFKYTGTAEEQTALANAKFTLKSGENEVKLISKGALEDGTAWYEVKTNAAEGDDGLTTTVISGTNGKIQIQGLDSGTYTLTETEAPAGYNLLTESITVKVDNQGNVTIGDGTSAVAQVEVLNNTGAELPSTGGTGTTIFYVLGSVLVLAAIVLFVTKRRMGAAK